MTHGGSPVRARDPALAAQVQARDREKATYLVVGAQNVASTNATEQ